MKAKKKKKAVHRVKSTFKEKQGKKRNYALSKSSVKGPKGTTKMTEFESTKKGVVRTKSKVTRKTKTGGSVSETKYTRKKPGKKMRTKIVHTKNGKVYKYKKKNKMKTRAG